MLGTPLYMPPEQWEGKDDVDGRVDIYALGMILYECLTGTYPFDAKSAMQLMYSHTYKEVPDPGERVELPGRLRQLVLTMVKKRPEDRPASMSVVEAELAQVLIELGVSPRLPGAGSSATWSPVIAGTPRPMAATTDPVLSFTAEPSMTGVGPLADSFVGKAAARPAEESGAAVAALPVAPAGTAAPARSRRLLPLVLAGGAILAIAAAAAVGLSRRGGAARGRPGDEAERPAATVPTEAAKLTAPTRLVALGPGQLLLGRHSEPSPASPTYLVPVQRFSIEAYEVSAAQWAEYTQASKLAAAPAVTAGSLPAVGVTREQAKGYCAWRHRSGRLPTEAEWEFAARDGHSDRPYPWSTATAAADEAPELPTRSGLPRANLGSPRPQLAPVDSHPLGATASRIYNLLGNAAEWTLSDAPAVSGSRTAPNLAVVRGGSAVTPARGLSAASRQLVPATRSDPFIGFRCVVSTP